MNGEINPWLIAQVSAAVSPQPERPAWLTDDIKKALDMYHLPYDRDGMLMLHAKTKANLDFYKEQEMVIRKACASILVPGRPEDNEGMNTVELGNGYKAKVSIKLNYNLDKDNDKVFAMQEAVAKIGNKGAFIAERLVTWTPAFLLTEYRALQEEAEDGSPEAKAILTEISKVLTITDAAPTLEIKEPKAKK